VWSLPVRERLRRWKIQNPNIVKRGKKRAVESGSGSVTYDAI